MGLLRASVLLLIGAGAARADLPSAANRVRIGGCGANHAPPALREDARLRRAAELIAGGATLDQAFAATGYVAARSSLLHFSGSVADSDVAVALARDGCKIIADPRLRFIGAARRPGEVWLVLATEAALPAPRNAAPLISGALELINSARATGVRCGGKWYPGAAPLIINGRLERAASEHADDMARHGYFRHEGLDGSTPASRVRRAGYGAYRIVGENIAAGAATSADAVRGWLASPGHCANIMDARFRDTGIAFAVNSHSRYGIYWTEDFAARPASTP